MAIGLGFCFLCVVYMIYVTVVQKAVVKIESSGLKNATIAAGFVSLTTGRVVYSDDERVRIRYYNEWDGAEYQKTLICANAYKKYPENSKVPIADILGLGPGSCLVVGFYKKNMQIISVIAFIMFGLGLVIKLKRKEIDKWQERKL